jgi:hypothetical protein
LCSFHGKEEDTVGEDLEIVCRKGYEYLIDGSLKFIKNYYNFVS